jgi:hypothetical protein
MRCRRGIYDVVMMRDAMSLCWYRNVQARATRETLSKHYRRLGLDPRTSAKKAEPPAIIRRRQTLGKEGRCGF